MTARPRLGRRAFLVGTPLLAGCRGCTSTERRPPIVAPPHELFYTTKGRIPAFVPGAVAHHFLETLPTDGGYVTRVVALTRANRTTATLTDAADSYPTLAVSPGFVWFRSKEEKLARVARSGGAVETFFDLPDSLYAIATDATGAFAFRPLDANRLSTNLDLVHVDERGALTVLARELFPDRGRRIATTETDVLFWSSIGDVTGPVAVAKGGGKPRSSARLDDDVVEEGSVYRSTSEGVFAVDPSTGALQKKLMDSTRDRVLGAHPRGLVLVRTDSRTLSFGSNSQAFSYAIDLYDFAAQGRVALFEPRSGRYVGGGAGGGAVAWATETEIGEVS